MGKVYIANTAPVPVQYWVNLGSMFSGRPCSTGGDLPAWTPRFVSATRQRDIARGLFGYGPNRLDVLFVGLTPPDTLHTFTVTITDSHSVDDPVVVYAFVGRLAVLTARGMPLPPDPNPLPSPGNPPADPSQQPWRQS